MDEKKNEIRLPSGAILNMTLASFEEGRNLYQAICREMTKIDLKADDELNLNLIKNSFFVLLCSKEVEECIWTCLKRCTYNKDRISSTSIFEEEDARQDYITVMKEVAVYNTAPFTKNLFAELKELTGMVEGFAQKSL